MAQFCGSKETQYDKSLWLIQPKLDPHVSTIDRYRYHYATNIFFKLILYLTLSVYGFDLKLNQILAIYMYI